MSENCGVGDRSYHSSIPDQEKVLENLDRPTLTNDLRYPVKSVHDFCFLK